MREDTSLGRVAFWALCVLAVLWAAGGLGGMLFGVIATPSMVWPLVIVLGPVALVLIAVIVDRLRSEEDRRYSRDVHD